MPEPRHRRALRRRWTGPLAIGLVLAFAGFLFASSARLGQSRADADAQSLREVVVAAKDRQTAQSRKVAELAQQQEKLVAAGDQSGADAAVLAGGDALAAGTNAVAGPGLAVTLDDAPVGGVKPPGTRPDDLVVHQGDIEAVLDALWVGGAEAVTIQGQRIGPTSAVRCVGNVLLLHGQVYSPPYVIQAIGPTQRMRQAVNQSAALKNYREWSDAVGLGWSVEAADRIEMPAFQATTRLEYAQATP